MHIIATVKAEKRLHNHVDKLMAVKSMGTHTLPLPQIMYRKHRYDLKMMYYTILCPYLRGWHARYMSIQIDICLATSLYLLLICFYHCLITNLLI